MSNIQYAVCHLQRGSGNDSGMSCHIERKTADGKEYIPDNADKTRTHLNRELFRFPEGVRNRTDAVQYRIDHAGLHRKVGKNQTKAIRIIPTGTHEQMMKIVQSGKLDKWTDANLRWLKDTFGEENVVSCVLHMDEKTPHLHATVVPIVTGERKRKSREGEKKYRTRTEPRLSADEEWDGCDCPLIKIPMPKPCVSSDCSAAWSGRQPNTSPTANTIDSRCCNTKTILPN